MLFTTKNLSKEVMARSTLRIKYLKHKAEENVSYILSKEINVFSHEKN